MLVEWWRACLLCLLGMLAVVCCAADGLHCVVMTLRRFLPTWMRLGPWQMVFWVSYEQLRQTAGLGSF